MARSSTAKVRLFDDGSHSDQKNFCLDPFFPLVNPSLLHFSSRGRPLLDWNQWANTGVINQVHLDFLWFIVGGSIHTAAHWLLLASDATEAQLASLPARVCTVCSLCLYSQNVRREWKARDVCARFLEVKLLRISPHGRQRLRQLWLHFQILSPHSPDRIPACLTWHSVQWSSHSETGANSITRPRGLSVQMFSPGAPASSLSPKTCMHACEAQWEFWIYCEWLFLSLCDPVISCGLVQGVAPPSTRNPPRQPFFCSVKQDQNLPHYFTEVWVWLRGSQVVQINTCIKTSGYSSWVKPFIWKSQKSASDCILTLDSSDSRI